MRLRDYSDQIPKPLVEVGQRPILWHLMKYYAHYGHKEFILCLGHGADKIKEYFLSYNECVDQRLRAHRRRARASSCSSTDIDDWRITFVDTGTNSNIGERLRRVRRHLGDDEMFLANYADGLSDLAARLATSKTFRRRDKTRRASSACPRRTRSTSCTPTTTATSTARAGRALAGADQRRVLRPATARSSTYMNPARSSSSSRSNA